MGQYYKPLLITKRGKITVSKYFDEKRKNDQTAEIFLWAFGLGGYVLFVYGRIGNLRGCDMENSFYFSYSAH